MRMIQRVNDAFFMDGDGSEDFSTMNSEEFLYSTTIDECDFSTWSGTFYSTWMSKDDVF